MRQIASSAPQALDIGPAPEQTPVIQERVNAKSLIAVTLGNGIEIYDFAVYSFFSVIIGHLFFPSDNNYVSLLLAVATFGVGFVMRPLGSIVLGNYTDKHGRRAGMTLIMGLMALGVMLVAFAPTYEQVGILAPVILLVGRLIQGFSAGGEVGASTSWLMEAGDKSRRGSRVSWQMTSQGAAALIGAGMGTGLTYALSQEALYDWGWRIPFILGLMIMPIGMYIRRTLPETHQTEKVVKKESSARTVWREHRRALILGIFLLMKGTTTFYIIVYYMPAYMVNTLHMPAKMSWWVSLMAAVLTLLVPWFGGKLADRLPRRKPLMVVSFVLSLLLIWPIFASILNQMPLALTLSLIAIDQILANVCTVVFFLLLLEAFPRKVRASGLSMVYAISVTLFGGFAQFNVTWLLKVTEDAMTPAWYLMFCSVISLIALLGWKENRSLANE